jgi:hypothetical protein
MRARKQHTLTATMKDAFRNLLGALFGALGAAAGAAPT